MRTLTKIIAPAVVAALGVGAALPASAHETRHAYHDVSRHAPRYTPARYTPARYTPARDHAIRADIRDLRARIDRAAARHAISYREARGLRRDTSRIQHLYARFARNGLDRQEVRVLRAKVDRVHYALRMERRDRNGHRG
ncbi:hypothetical protein [Novosphingobium beihaiensis]|uniref:Heavy-metal resistance protein n=1 Tax=Novosphingobium beihaiensis TaxID=2930389 RepID=A0ABT0BVX8_9SPHN|nr:hypothetical protein [Novosphingobium beihaiensis]MCJ2188956.1 hypothetical protein [Novosphingobium beihaiensis]